MTQGALAGIRVLEFDALGPVPFAAMLLADMGAEIVRIARPSSAPMRADPCDRGRAIVSLDLKTSKGREQGFALAMGADILLEGNRPGVMERLGLGPEEILLANPALVYGRMTGWGQEGPLAHRAGHDINYLALSGALGSIGSPEQPIPPLNLVADLGGGALFLVAGLLAALLHSRQTGEGQVIDCAMVEGAASLMTSYYGLAGRGLWNPNRGQNLGDGGAYFYGTYRCSDDGWMAVGAIEPQFHDAFLACVGLDEPQPAPAKRWEPGCWPVMRKLVAERFAEQPRAYWEARFADFDACVTPVLTMKEVSSHPQIQSRGAFVRRGDIDLPGPVPRLSATPSTMALPAHGAEAATVITAWTRKASRSCAYRRRRGS